MGRVKKQNKEIYLFNPFFLYSQQATYVIRVFWLTLHNCEIYYLTAVIYGPATTDLIFIRINIYLGPGVGGL